MKNSNRWQFAILSMLIYGILMLVPLASHDWDVSRFVVAGDRYVDKDKLDSPIQIREKSDGYDGQFYYRLAIEPNASTKAAHGVTFDAPAWRQQRIGYPVLGYLLSWGQPALVPLALFVINLIGIGILALSVRSLQNQLQLQSWFSWAVMLWPGYAVTLTHDTTEIVAVALLTLALNAYVSGRYVWYMILAALTTLTRETSIILFGGIFVYNAFKIKPWNWLRAQSITAVWRDPAGQKAIRQIFWIGLAMVPYLAWWQYLTLHWGVSPQQSGNNNMGPPFVGLAQTILESITGMRHWGGNPLSNALNRIVMGVGATAIGLSILFLIARSSEFIRRNDAVSAIFVGWLLMAIPMSTLKAYVEGVAAGPWGEIAAAYRAFTEFWAVTLILLASSQLRLPRWCMPCAFLIWGLSAGATL